ncbi:MAG: VIT1/CCC1 transporter family protein, partial [Notoacmeibacter sp.]
MKQPAMTEHHTATRTGWLRAAVLGANDGLISTASLIVGVAAAASDTRSIIVAGLAGLVAGSMSMAAGEYVSVSSQADSENADLERERREIELQPEVEIEELAQTFVARGAELETARAMSAQLSAKDALGAHAREELGIS